MSSFPNNGFSSSPFEKTVVFQITRLNSLISACDNLLSIVSELDKQRANFAQDEKHLTEKKREIDQQHSDRIDKVSKSLNEAQEELANAEVKTRLLRDRHTKLEAVSVNLPVAFPGLKFPELFHLFPD